MCIVHASGSNPNSVRHQNSLTITFSVLCSRQIPHYSLLRINISTKLITVHKHLCSPQHQLLNTGYGGLIEQLNSQLSEKADTQITLNDTRNAIQCTMENISHVHSARKDLHDSLIRESKQYEETKKMLEKEVLKRYSD